MAYAHVWGNPSKTSGYFIGAKFVYTSGIPMPTGRVDFYGNRPLRTYGFYNTYASGGSGAFYRMNYGGTLSDGGNHHFGNVGGGTFQFELHNGGGTLYFGRDEGAGRSVVDSGGGSWAGTLAGAFNYAVVPNPPGISASRSVRSISVSVSAPDNGGATITQYTVQYSKDGGGWTGTRTGGSTTYADLAPGNYQFRTWANNEVGASQPAYTGTITVPNVPSAPSSISAVRTGRSVTVSLGTSPSTGGATISGYYTRKRVSGGAWDALVAAPSRTYTYSDLDAGLTYEFEGVARNEIGDSPAIAATPLFVPAGGERWDTASGQWVATVSAERFDPVLGWVDLQDAERWDAATQTWKDLT